MCVLHIFAPYPSLSTTLSIPFTVICYSLTVMQHLKSVCFVVRGCLKTIMDYKCKACFLNSCSI